MTDYTPTTEQVRDAYVRGMRDTFIASAGEHREEFDRWMQAHDDEVRASVQPPTREQIAEALHGAPHGDDCGAYMDTDYGPAFTSERMCTCWKRDFLALFQQPAPSAEPTASERWVQLAQDTTEGNTDALKERLRDLPGYAIEPPSIADMAPGTTFTAVDPGRLGDRAMFEVLNDHRGRNVDTWVHWAPTSFNSSTIRDVTPPPATPEEGDRG